MIISHPEVPKIRDYWLRGEDEIIVIFLGIVVCESRCAIVDEQPIVILCHSNKSVWSISSVTCTCSVARVYRLCLSCSSSGYSKSTSSMYPSLLSLRAFKISISLGDFHLIQYL